MLLSHKKAGIDHAIIIWISPTYLLNESHQRRGFSDSMFMTFPDIGSQQSPFLGRDRL